MLEANCVLSQEGGGVIAEKATYCRICEPLCGLIATVENGRLVDVRPDKDNPISKGFACPKGIGMISVHNSSDRLLHPMHRQPDGSFVRVSWDLALKDIGERLRTIIAEHGKDAIGVYFGNPTAFSYSAFTWVKGMTDALGSPHFYSSGSQDTNTRFVASKLLYGSPLTISVPDLHRTDFLFMLGANPVVSHGSMVSGIHVRAALNDIVARGGRVVVVDPRRTETARLYEHVAVKPDGDAWLLLALLHTVFAERLEDAHAMADVAVGAETLKEWVEPFRPEDVEHRCGVPAAQIRSLARDLASADSAVCYGRVGACVGGFGTLVCFLLDTLNLVTGNLDRPGGAVFPTPPIDTNGFIVQQGLDTYATKKSRIGQLPEVMGSMPAAVMAEEIRTPGPGQLRAVVVLSGNPVLSVPAGHNLAEAMTELDLLISLDIGVNDTNRHADYILPATTFFERDDFPMAMLPFQLRSFMQWTEPVVAPAGEARQEWTVLRDICAEIDVVPSSSAAVRRLGRLGRKLGPRLIFDAMLRVGPHGDRFGLRPGGLSFKRLRRKYPHGVVLSETVGTGVLRDRITHDDHFVHLAPSELRQEVDRLSAQADSDPEYPLRLFGRRELRSINSWMKNSPKLMAGGRGPTCCIHPDDADQLALHDGALARITSKAGSVEARIEVTDDVVPGSVCLPHGWGQRVDVAGNRSGVGGPDYNALTADGAAAVEPLAGMSILNGVRVRVEPIPVSR